MISTKLLNTVYRVPHTAKRKLYNFSKDPRGILTSKLKAILGEQRYANLQYSSPIYDVRRWVLNREGKREYEAERTHMQLNSLQRRIVTDLRERGIAIVRFSELFPNTDFRELQAFAESLLQKSENQEQVTKILDGFRPDNPLGLVMKFYLVRLLGDNPAFYHNDKFVKLVLSDEILGIVCDYFGSFVRIADMDFWCNVPTEERDTYSQTWHRDSEDKKLVKLFLWLRDVDETTGPFYYVPGSHSEGAYRTFYPQTRVRSQYPPAGEVDKHFSVEQRKAYTGEAGTLILCDTAGIHKGGHPTKGMRLLFTALYSTDAGWDYGDRFSILGLDRERLGPAARFAAGRARTYRIT
jgi:Phytanoyl-CoA dioxygenase (PhyH)